VHRFARKTLHHRNSWNDDALLAHPHNQSVDQDFPVSDAHRFPSQPICQLGSARSGEVAIMMATLDSGELLVASLQPPRELRDDFDTDADLLGDMVEHNCRQCLALTQMATRIAKAA
jgi:hypothetical protein